MDFTRIINKGLLIGCSLLWMSIGMAQSGEVSSDPHNVSIIDLTPVSGSSEKEQLRTHQHLLLGKNVVNSVVVDFDLSKSKAASKFKDRVNITENILREKEKEALRSMDFKLEHPKSDLTILLVEENLAHQNPYFLSLAEVLSSSERDETGSRLLILRLPSGSSESKNARINSQLNRHPARLESNESLSLKEKGFIFLMNIGGKLTKVIFSGGSSEEKLLDLSQGSFSHIISSIILSKMEGSVNDYLKTKFKDFKTKIELKYNSIVSKTNEKLSKYNLSVHPSVTKFLLVYTLSVASAVSTGAVSEAFSSIQTMATSGLDFSVLTESIGNFKGQVLDVMLATFPATLMNLNIEKIIKGQKEYHNAEVQNSDIKTALLLHGVALGAVTTILNQLGVSTLELYTILSLTTTFAWYSFKIAIGQAQAPTRENITRFATETASEKIDGASRLLKNAMTRVNVTCKRVLFGN